jgi:hypothetical protein
VQHHRSARPSALTIGATLTVDQARQLEVLRERWLQSIFSTKPANRKNAEDGVRHTYRAAGVKQPDLFLWFDGLLEAAIAVEQLGPSVDSNWMLPPKALKHRKRVQGDVRHKLGLRTWRQVIKTIGPEHTGNRFEEREVLNTSGVGKPALRANLAVEREDSLQAGLAPFDPEGIPDCPAVERVVREIDAAAANLREQQRKLLKCYMGPGIPGHSSLDSLFPVFARDYPLGFLAMHEFLFRICRVKASVPYTGLCLTAHNCSAWWPFANAAILADHPRELHLDAQGKLHNLVGPAIVYRSGLGLHAWHGAFRLPANAPAARAAIGPPGFME